MELIQEMQNRIIVQQLREHFYDSNARGARFLNLGSQMTSLIHIYFMNNHKYSINALMTIWTLNLEPPSIILKHKHNHG